MTYQYENNQNSQEEINLPEDNLLESYTNNNNYFKCYQTTKDSPRFYSNNSNDSYLNRTSPKENYNYINNEKKGIPYHHHHIYHIHHHCHTPCRTHSTSRSRSRSPSPINNISQPLISPNLNIVNESINRSKLFNSNENGNNISSNNFNYEDIENNDKINNIIIKRFKENEIDNNNNSFINNNDQINHFNALAFDEEMSKLAMNKLNKMKQYNESYFFKKEFGEDLNKNNFNNIINNDNNLDKFKIMRQNLEEKYKLYNLITKYDNVKYNNETINKENYNKNLTEENNKENYEELINSKKINKYKENNINEENKNINMKKYKYKKYKYKNNDDEEKEINNISTKKHKDNTKNNKNHTLYSSHSDSSTEKKNNFLSDENNKNKIQKVFNERIGQDNNNKKKSYDKKNNNLINNEEKMNESNLLDFLKNENRELKKLNNSYKQVLDTLFYFLNNISHKYTNDNEKSNNNKENSDLFDLSKDLGNKDDFSKKLINLEFLINEGKDKDKNNNNKINNDDNNNLINKIKNKSYPLLIITKENSIQLPEVSNLMKFNDLIEGMEEKCFSFKNENFIEKYKKIDKNDEKNKYLINLDNNNKNNNKDFDNELIDKMNDEGDRCVACLLGCNISKRGYSPMRYNPYNKNELRIDDSGDLFDRYNELKENMDKNKDNENKIKKIRNYNKISKSRDSSKNNTLNNSRNNSKSTKPKKKVWK